MSPAAGMMRLAGTAAALGISPAPIVMASDPVDVEIWGRVVSEAATARRTLDESLAASIANAVGKLFGGD